MVFFFFVISVLLLYIVYTIELCHFKNRFKASPMLFKTLLKLLLSVKLYFLTPVCIGTCSTEQYQAPYTLFHNPLPINLNAYQIARTYFKDLSPIDLNGVWINVKNFGTVQ